MRRNIYSVGQLNNYIKNMFAQDFMLRQLSIKGEVSNCKYHSSGHIYFTLKDESGTLACVMFYGSRRTGLNFRMKEGDKVIVTGSVEIYERTGSYQLYARKIEPDGEGNLYLRYEALKKELEEMGMFAPEYKKPIPKYASKVGIVTAPTGAAIQDIRNISHRRNPGVQLILYPAQVQGDGAAQTIVNGIRALEQLQVDVIIVGRGGGSIEDLWAFNEEIVARAIFDCQIPVISAVGHETDWTIADFVSDLRAPTPSAAAELAVFDLHEVHRQLEHRMVRMTMLQESAIRYAKERLAHAQTRLYYLSPRMKMNENRRRADEYSADLEKSMQRLLQVKRQQLALLSGRLDANSPARKIAGGFAYAETEDKKPLTGIDQVNSGDYLQLYLSDGTIKAQVQEIHKYNRVDSYDAGK